MRTANEPGYTKILNPFFCMWSNALRAILGTPSSSLGMSSGVRHTAGCTCRYILKCISTCLVTFLGYMQKDLLGARPATPCNMLRRVPCTAQGAQLKNTCWCNAKENKSITLLGASTAATLNEISTYLRLSQSAPKSNPDTLWKELNTCCIQSLNALNTIQDPPENVLNACLGTCQVWGWCRSDQISN